MVIMRLNYEEAGREGEEGEEAAVAAEGVS